MAESILVYTPMLRLYGRALQSILRLEWPGRLDIMFDKGNNCPVDDLQKRFEYVTAKYNHGRTVTLAGDYAAMLQIEDDMIVPPDTLMRLWDTGADIAYGLYCWRHGDMRWSAYTEISDGHGTSLSQNRAAAQAAWGKVIDVQGIGSGCTLIRRHVLECLPFRKHRDACCDWGLAMDAQAAGFRQVCDLGVVCGHMTSEMDTRPAFPITYGKKGPPRIIWPDPDREGLGQLYRVEYL